MKTPNASSGHLHMLIIPTLWLFAVTQCAGFRKVRDNPNILPIFFDEMRHTSFWGYNLKNWNDWVLIEMLVEWKGEKRWFLNSLLASAIDDMRLRWYKWVEWIFKQSGILLFHPSAVFFLDQQIKPLVLVFISNERRPFILLQHRAGLGRAREGHKGEGGKAQLEHADLCPARMFGCRCLFVLHVLSWK